MIFNFVRMWNPSRRSDAIDALKSIAKMDTVVAVHVVDVVTIGINTSVKLPDTIDRDDLKQLGRYFEIRTEAGSPITTVAEIHLKLWEVQFIRDNPRTSGTALVLAETKEIAENGIIGSVVVHGSVNATEVQGPFINGQVLTTTITTK